MQWERDANGVETLRFENTVFELRTLKRKADGQIGYYTYRRHDGQPKDSGWNGVPFLTPELAREDAEAWIRERSITRNAADIVTGQRHYHQHASGVEAWDIVEWLPGNLFNSLKYLWRSGLKGSAAEDIAKALNYTRRELQRLETYPEEAIRAYRAGAPDAYYRKMALVLEHETGDRRLAMALLMSVVYIGDPRGALQQVVALLEEM